MINKWFFIRYGDPDWHIRLRLFVNHGCDVNIIFSLLNGTTNILVSNGVYKVQFDTYQREIERYGQKHIESIESVFCCDSEFVSALLCESQINDYSFEMRWKYAFYSLNSAINALGFSCFEAFNLFDSMSKYLFNEFGGSDELKSNLSKNCREFRQEVSSSLDLIHLSNNSRLLLERRNELLQMLYEECKMNEILRKEFIGNLLPSIIHMHCNRIFTFDQRKYELMIYELLSRYFKSQTFLIK